MWLHPWRPLGAVATALIVALCVYRLADNLRDAHPGRLTDEIAALDAESVAELHDLLRAFVPADEYVPAVSPDDESMLAALPLWDFIGLPRAPEIPHASHLEDSELDGVGDLIGDRVDLAAGWVAATATNARGN